MAHKTLTEWRPANPRMYADTRVLARRTAVQSFFEARTDPSPGKPWAKMA